MNEILIEQCSYLIDDTLPNITNISNLIALLYHEMENINWLGFYICDETNGSLTLAHSRNSQMSFMYGFFFVKFLIFAVVCVVIMI